MEGTGKVRKERKEGKEGGKNKGTNKDGMADLLSFSGSFILRRRK